MIVFALLGTQWEARKLSQGRSCDIIREVQLEMDCGAVFCQHCLVSANPSHCFDSCLKIIRKSFLVYNWIKMNLRDQWIILLPKTVLCYIQCLID